MPAGGRGERFGGTTPKQLVEIDGKPLLTWTLERLLAAGLEGLTVALPESWLQTISQIFDDRAAVTWVAGGETRQDSVAACLRAAPEDVDLMLVHDGARPAVAVRDVQATVAAVGVDHGAVLGRPVVDTIKRLDGDRIIETVDRRALFRAETPQVFRREILSQALERCAREEFTGTDEATAVERLEGARINVARATLPNPKLTRQQDLAWIQMLLRQNGDSA